MRLTICESAVNNSDGTYDIVRGGLDRFASAPVRIVAMLFVEGSPDEFPQAPLAVNVLITEPGGQRITMSGMAMAPAKGDVVRFVMPFDVTAAAAGVVMLQVSIGAANAVATIRVG